MAMRGNIYDDMYSDGAAIAHPSEDLGPSTMLQRWGQKNGDYAPGTCGSYSTMSYYLVGLILLNQSGKAWDEYDQNVWRDILPNVTFGIHGPCKMYTAIAAKATCGQFCGDEFSDSVADITCDNGFAGGNIIGRTRDMAQFQRMLFGGRGELLRTETVTQMNGFSEQLGDGCWSWDPGMSYGLGVEFKYSQRNPKACDACDCDCSWVEQYGCGNDDKSCCYDCCCGGPVHVPTPREPLANKTCSTEVRGGGTCDCSWVSKYGCADSDDGSACWGCCCVEPRSFRFQGHSGMVRGFFAATHYDADLDISISVSVGSNDDAHDPHRIWWDVHGSFARGWGRDLKVVMCAIGAGVLLICLLCHFVKRLRAKKDRQAQAREESVATQSPPLKTALVDSSPSNPSRTDPV